ncbi:GNAT family N-acetyltransferase [Streptomyces sp. NPDC015127]|uniref:GNAT family N-acetyltransferase n=1 Tax=Streptomyces sp. NPDC015127 TaxID=3364939 RepID=UPI00370311EA
MNDSVAVERLAAADLPAVASGLGALLVDAVDDGASVGFTSALTPEEAAAWWSDLAPALADDRIAVWTARDGDRLVGTVQLRCESSPNGRHRAEIAKLVVHRAARGRGIARRLLTTAEEFAGSSGRTLLMLDTQTGSTAERLYRSAGWTPLGTVPDYAADPAGVLRPTTFFHKILLPAPPAAQGSERSVELTGPQPGLEA